MKTLFFITLFLCNTGFTSTNGGGGPKSLEYFGNENRTTGSNFVFSRPINSNFDFENIEKKSSRLESLLKSNNSTEESHEEIKAE